MHSQSSTMCALPYPGPLCSLLGSWKGLWKQAWGNRESPTPPFPHAIPKYLLNSHTFSSFNVMVQSHRLRISFSFTWRLFLGSPAQSQTVVYFKQLKTKPTLMEYGFWFKLRDILGKRLHFHIYHVKYPSTVQ